MSARVDLLAAAMYGYSRGEAEALIDAFAHELAEKIRADIDSINTFYAGMSSAADLIDPEVTE